MFDILLTYLENVEEENIPNIDMETLAVSNAILRSYPSSSPERDKLEFIVPLTQNWINQGYYEINADNPKRQQHLLRKLLDKLVLEGVTSLNRSEIDLLLTVHDLMVQIDAPEKFQRLHYLFDRNMTQIDQHGKDLPPCQGLKGLPSLLTYVTSKELEKAPKRITKSFGGVEVDLKGNYYNQKGDVKVLDFVPDNTAIIVEEGSCIVSGYVFGHVFASLDADILKNISGTVIAGQGDVRGESAIKNSFIVSKCGEVFLNKTEDPTLIFAAQKISITDNTHFGTYAAPYIEIGKAVNGGEYHFTNTLKAECFEVPDTRPLILEFKDKIGPEFYGNSISLDIRRQLATLNQLKSREIHFKKLIDVSQNECENYANNGILYLVGGEALLSRIDNISKSHRRFAFLQRMISGLDSLISESKSRLVSKESNGNTLASTPTGLMTALNEEWAEIEQDIELDKDLKDEGMELNKLTQSLIKQYPVTPNIIENLKEKRNLWVNEISKVKEEIKGMEDFLQQSVGNPKITNTEDSSRSKIQLLAKLIQHAQSNNSNPKLTQNTSSPFIKLILRSINTRRQQIITSEVILKDICAQQEDVKTILITEHQMKFLDEETTKTSPQASGIFNKGAILCTSVHLAERWIKAIADSEDPNDFGIHVIQDTSQNTRMFTLEDDQIVEGRPAMA